MANPSHNGKNKEYVWRTAPVSIQTSVCIHYVVVWKSTWTWNVLKTGYSSQWASSPNLFLFRLLYSCTHWSEKSAGLLVLSSKRKTLSITRHPFHKVCVHILYISCEYWISEHPARTWRHQQTLTLFRSVCTAVKNEWKQMNGTKWQPWI